MLDCRILFGNNHSVSRNLPLDKMPATERRDLRFPCFDAIFANKFVRLCNSDLGEMCALHRHISSGSVRAHPVKSLSLLLTASGRDNLYNSARARCTKCTEIAPSPTAEATRFRLPARTSPTAKTPGRLVSSICGARASGQAID